MAALLGSGEATGGAGTRHAVNHPEDLVSGTQVTTQRGDGTTVGFENKTTKQRINLLRGTGGGGRPTVRVQFEVLDAPRPAEVTALEAAMRRVQTDVVSKIADVDFEFRGVEQVDDNVVSRMRS